MKIAVHMYFEERQHYFPAMSEFKPLQNPLNSIGDTAVHADRTKCHKQKQLRRFKAGSHLRHNDITGRSRKPKKCLVLMFYAVFYVSSVNNIS